MHGMNGERTLTMTDPFSEGSMRRGGISPSLFQLALQRAQPSPLWSHIARDHAPKEPYRCMDSGGSTAQAGGCCRLKNIDKLCF